MANPLVYLGGSQRLRRVYIEISGRLWRNAKRANILESTLESIEKAKGGKWEQNYKCSYFEEKVKESDYSK